MKMHVKLEDLWAYIDGEAKDAERVRAHLQQCAECAQRHVAMAKVSAGVQALPVPELRGGLASRVVAVIEDSEAHRGSWWQRVGAPVAVAAALLLTAGLFAVQSGTDTTVPDIAQRGEEYVANPPMAQGVGESFEPANEWSGSDWIMADARRAEQPVNETENILMALSDVPWFDGLTASAGDGRNVDAVFAAAYSRQPEAVLDAFTMYARSGDAR